MKKISIVVLRNKKGEEEKDFRGRIVKAIKKQPVDAVLIGGVPARIYCQDAKLDNLVFLLKRDGGFQVIRDPGNFVSDGEIMSSLSIWESTVNIKDFLKGNGKHRWMK